MSVFIVAEAGCNHLGDRAKMLALCDAAKAAGADAVKFQAYETWKLCERRGMMSDDGCYTKNEHVETRDLLEKSQLTDDDLDAIAAHCAFIGIKWFASVFSPDQIERVLSRGACCLKIGHAEAGWAELVNQCWDHMPEVPVWRSINDPLRGYMGGSVWCVSEYPADGHDPMLGKVGDHGHEGFSSHYTDYRIPAAAALRGAEYIEFHIATDTDQPEAAWSLMPDDAKKCVDLIREYSSWL